MDFTYLLSHANPCSCYKNHNINIRNVGLYMTLQIKNFPFKGVLSEKIKEN